MTLPQKWNIIDIDKQKVEEIQKEYNFSKSFSKALVGRGIDKEVAVKKIISPGTESLHSPSLLPDIEKGFNRIRKAIEDREKILIWGDEDTDGITATVLLFELLKNLNTKVVYHIPSRKDEGIGLNISGIRKAAEMGCSLIITVDCSSSDLNNIMKAKKYGIDVIVTDHHEVLINGENDFLLINPKRKDSVYPFRDLSGVTVAFKLGWFIAKKMLSLNSQEWESFIKEWYPLIFLGTYADRVPLKDENWTLSKLGFNALRKTERMGIKVLIEVLCKDNGCDEGAIQKMISVLSSAKTNGWGENIGFRILTENNKDYLHKTIAQLLKKSEEWHSLANENFRRIFSSLKDKIKKKIVFIYEPKTPFDCLGFCASRLKERLNRPVIITANKDNYIIGEARAPLDFDIHKLLSEHRHLFLSFGGHKPACGFSIQRENLDNLRTLLSRDCPEIKYEDGKQKELRIVDILPLEKITKKIKDEITLLTPFGSCNPPPFFLAQNVSISKGVYTYEIPDTGEQKRIEMKSSYQTWIGIDGKPITLDIVYYINSAGVPTIADARPSLFNESIIQK